MPRLSVPWRMVDIMDIPFGGFLKWGYPNGPKLAGWFSSWKILLKWMTTGDTPILGNHHLREKMMINRGILGKTDDEKHGIIFRAEMDFLQSYPSCWSYSMETTQWFRVVPAYWESTCALNQGLRLSPLLLSDKNLGTNLENDCGESKFWPFRISPEMGYGCPPKTFIFCFANATWCAPIAIWNVVVEVPSLFPTKLAAPRRIKTCSKGLPHRKGLFILSFFLSFLGNPRIEFQPEFFFWGYFP